MPSTNSSAGSHVSADEDPYRKAKYMYGAISRRFVAASLISLAGYVMLIVAFSSPYWLSSYEISFSEFKRLGLWDFCFDNYRHPSYQYDEKFTGCHWIYSATYQNIRDWLQPGWFMFVQAMLTLALLAATTAAALLGLILMYYLVKQRLVLVLLTVAFQGLSALLLLIGLSIFRMWCYDRSWLMYPSFNYLDWAYYAAWLSAILYLISTMAILRESIDVRHRIRKAKTLIYDMQPQSPPTPAYSISQRDENPYGGSRQISISRQTPPAVIHDQYHPHRDQRDGGGGRDRDRGHYGERHGPRGNGHHQQQQQQLFTTV